MQETLQQENSNAPIQAVTYLSIGNKRLSDWHLSRCCFPEDQRVLNPFSGRK
jgi:hypothetical protein